MSRERLSLRLHSKVAGLLALAAVACYAGGGAANATAQPAAVSVDDLGQALAQPTAPARVISLLPSLTETVCALGACERLVGVDRYSDWPAKPVALLPKVGGGLDPNIEAIVALRPDVVLLSADRRTVQRLHRLGVRTVALEPRNLADVQRTLYSVAQVLQLPSATAMRTWQQLHSGIQEAAASVPKAARGARVYFEVNSGPFAAAPDSFIGELLAQLQVDNVVPSGRGPFPRLSPEFVVRAQPDVIVMGRYSQQSGGGYPGWETLRAVQQQRVCQLSAAQSSLVVRPGPRMDEAAHIMATCLREKAPPHASE